MAFRSMSQPYNSRLRTASAGGKLGRKERGLAARSTPVLLRARSSIEIGDRLPEATFTYFDQEDNMMDISTSDLCEGKKVVLFAVAGAFTPTCSMKHLPSFIDMSEELKEKGVDTIACLSVNDAFVMRAWGRFVGAEDKVLMLADGSGHFTQAIGVELDLKEKGLGIRSRRYSMLVDDGEVVELNLEPGGGLTISSAETILAKL